jgi:hypothetical protein
MTREDFIAEWNELDVRERKHLRRLVRLGRPIEEPKFEALAPEYAQLQRDKPWMKLFWLWFVPGVLLALSVASQMHPIFVGIVIALAAQAVFAHRNLKKASLSALA